MNRKAPLSARLLFCLSLFFFASCQKIHFDDFLNPDNTPKLCLVKQIISYADPEFFLDTLTREFKYNKWGDPVSIELIPAQPSIPDFFFLYDNQHRLTDFVSAYKNEHFEQWHHYAYERNRIVRDTVRVFGTIVNGQPVEDEKYSPYTTIHHFEYDLHNRIVKETFPFSIFPPQLTMIITYSYDQAGNLSRVTTYVPEFNNTNEINYSSYDNKLNIHRTNKVWMLIDRDYSVNNRIRAENYNQFGLPLKFRSPGNTYPFVYGHNISESDIKYECK